MASGRRGEGQRSCGCTTDAQETSQSPSRGGGVVVSQASENTPTVESGEVRGRHGLAQNWVFSSAYAELGVQGILISRTAQQA